MALKTPLGIIVISDVLYISNLSENLLSVGQMLEKGYSLNFSSKCCKIVYSILSYGIHAYEPCLQAIL